MAKRTLRLAESELCSLIEKMAKAIMAEEKMTVKKRHIRLEDEDEEDVLDEAPEIAEPTIKPKTKPQTPAKPKPGNPFQPKKHPNVQPKPKAVFKNEKSL